jgi:hypothetical protein
MLVHAMLLSLIFGSQGFGPPGFGLPWQERRFEADDLYVVLVPTLVPSATQALIEPSANLRQTGMVSSETLAASGAKDVMTPNLDGGPEYVASSPIPSAALIALDRSYTATFVVPATPQVPTTVIAAESNTMSPVVRERALELTRFTRPKQEVQQQADQMDEALEIAARQQTERREAERVESMRVDAERREAERQAAIRQEAERVEATRLDAERREVVRQAAIRQEAERFESMRVDAERREAVRQAAIRQEADRVEATRLDAEHREAARQETARQERERQEAERAEREAALRAIGRQLDEEAARRDAASLAAHPSSMPLTSSSLARRGRLFGRTDPNPELIQYAEAWSRKIELNLTLDMVRVAAKQRHTNPLVTVALRSDGSVESVSFVVSSGVVEIDEAIRRIVQSQSPYQSFSPGLAREYDVIEIRRSWYFDTAVRLY